MHQLTLFDTEYQPRFQAFLDYKGASHKDEVRMYEFIVWINQHVEEFKQDKGITGLHGYHNEFTEYLREVEHK